MAANRIEHVVIVDDGDATLGVAGKLEAHRGPGLLHRAVSACLFDPRGRVLLQRRSMAKYHFAGRWSNACCTHPRPGESPREAIARRVKEELGVVPRDLHAAGSFTYRAEDPSSGFVEHELDHVFTGVFADALVPDPDEVMEWRVVDRAELATTDWRAADYTPWLEGVLRLAGLRAST